jgi:glycosyltransferase 2 family protein
MPASGHRTVLSVVRRSAGKLLRTVVAAVLLYYIFSYIGLQTVITAINRADSSVLWLAFLVAIIVQLVVSYRLKRLTDVQGLHLPTSLVFEVNLATRFYGLFLPGGNLTALLIRIFKFTRERSQVASVVVSLFADRIMATLSLCILGLVFWAQAQPQPDELWLLVFALATTACLVPTCVLFFQSFSPGLYRLARLLHRLSPGLREKLSYAFQRSRQTSGKVLVSSFTLSVMAHLVGIVCYWLIAQSLDMELSLLVIAWIRSGMMLVTLLPVTIAGLGVREVAALMLLQHYGVESDIAVAFSMLVFAATVVGIALLGGLTEAWRFVYSRGR